MEYLSARDKPTTDDDPPVVLRCGLLIDGSGTAGLEDHALVIEGGSIKVIEPWDEPSHGRGTPGGVRDLRGHSVLPGLIDGHAHPFIGSPTSVRWRGVTKDPITTVVWGLASCQAALRSGVTTIVDVGSPGGVAIQAAMLLRTGLVTGPDLLAAGAAITTTAGHASEECGICADNAEELVSTVRRTVAQGANLVKLMVTGGATDPSSNRRRAQYSQLELTAAIEDAHRLGKIVVGHANATEGISRAVHAGIDIVAHCNWLGSDPGTVVVDSATVEEMRARGVRIDLNIDGALRDLSSTDGRVIDWRYPGAVPATRWDLLQPLRREGIDTYLTSDAFGPSVGTFTTALQTARERWQIAVEELIHLVSGLPARALGIGDRGTLKPGNRADILVLKGDLREPSTALTGPAHVYRAGSEVVRDGWIAASPVALDSGSEALAQERFLAQAFSEPI